MLDFDDDGRLIGLDLERASHTVDVSDLEMHEQPVGNDADAAHADGKNSKRERRALGFSQAELGRKLSVSANTIARWERGELKIEHPEMLQLALATLRRNSQQVDRVPVPPHMEKFRSTGERRVTRDSATGEFTSVKRNKSRHSSDAERVKKK